MKITDEYYQNQIVRIQNIVLIIIYIYYNINLFDLVFIIYVYNYIFFSFFFKVRLFVENLQFIHICVQ